MITREKVAEVLAVVVDEFGPETTYADVCEANGVEYTPDVDTCQYSTEGGRPLCIVGQVLHKLGLPLPSYPNYQGANGLLHQDYEGQFTPEAVTYLRDAQIQQDLGEKWGDL